MLSSLVALFRGDDLVALFPKAVVAREWIPRLLSDELLESPDLSLRDLDAEEDGRPVLLSGLAFQEWLAEERIARG